MPRTDAVCILRFLWVAWTVNDLGQHGHTRFGWNEQQARTRAAWKA